MVVFIRIYIFTSCNSSDRDLKKPDSGDKFDLGFIKFLILCMKKVLLGMR